MPQRNSHVALPVVFPAAAGVTR